MPADDSTPRAPDRPASAKPGVRGGRLARFVPLLLLFAVTAAAYAPARHLGFIWDDDDYVVENETLTSAGGLRRIWTEIGATPQYYPLVHTSFWIEYRVHGLEPAGFHVVNVLLHALGACLLFRLLRRLEVPGALLAAALFAVHPIQVESVAWITERKNVLSGVFFFAAAIAYLRHALPAPGERTGGFGGWLLAFLLFVAALLAKTVTAVLPPALLLCLIWKRRRFAPGDLLRLLPFFAAGIALALLTVWMEKHQVGATGGEWSHGALDRVLIAARILAFYPTKLVWPAEQIFVYPRFAIDSGLPAAWIALAGALAVPLALFLLRRRLGAGPLVAVLAYAGLLFPALGFFDVYPMRYSFVADHFQYLAGVPLLALAAAAVTSICHAVVPDRARADALVFGISAVLLLPLGWLTRSNLPVYTDVESLWRHTLEKNPGAWIAHNNLGNFLSRDGRFAEAIPHYLEVIALEPRHDNAHFNLGNAYRALGRADEAIASYRRALAIRPEWPSVHGALGLALQDRGLLDEAIGSFREALRLAGDSVAHFNLASALHAAGSRAEALDHYRSSSSGEMAVPARVRMGQMMEEEDKPELAMRAYRDALRIDPTHAEARLALAGALAATGKPDDALAVLQQILTENGELPLALSQAAVLLATHQDPARRDLERAIFLAERAVYLTKQSQPANLVFLAEVYEAASKKHRARAAAQSALSLIPPSTPPSPLARRATALIGRLDSP